jgi:imidazolonepropionase-like amidohydrolase
MRTRREISLVSAALGLAVSLGLAQGPQASLQQPGSQQPAPQPQPAAPIPWRPLPSPVPEESAAEETVAIHVKRAITIAGEPIDDATILVRGGKIAAIGKIVDVPKGARRLDYANLTAMPGLVLAVSRAGYVPRSAPQGAATRGKDGIDPDAEIYDWAAKAGITTMAIVPPGSGIVGMATVIRPRGKTVDEMLKKEDAYLFSVFELGSPAKDNFRTSFERARDAMEQFEKAQKDAAASQPAGQPQPSGPPASAPATGPASQPAGPPAGQAAARPAGPPKLDPKIEPLVKVLKKEKKLVTQLGGAAGPFGFGGGTGAAAPAAELVHFQDAMKKFDIDRLVTGGANLALVADRVKEMKALALVTAEENSLEPYTRNRLNGAEELRRAGIKVGFLPTAESRDAYQNWLYKAGEMVKMGFPEKEALRAVTLTPAEYLGMGEQVGSLAAGRDADILFLDGAPFDASTKPVHVMIGGELVEELEKP